MIHLKSENELKLMHKANQIVAATLDLLEEEVKPGVTTKYLNEIAEANIRKLGAKPAFKGYQGFPAALCISINEEIVHGIPGKRVVKDGDIVSCDIGAYYKGFYGDAAATFPVGEVSDEAKRLIKVTADSLEKGISEAKVGNRLYDISHAIQTHVEKNGFSVVRMFVGHGIGRRLHEDPQIPNFGVKGRGVRLKKGMVLAIEPMVNVGKYGVKILKDGWTAITEDGTLSAHFEHSVAITNGTAEILSLRKKRCYNSCC